MGDDLRRYLRRLEPDERELVLSGRHSDVEGAVAVNRGGLRLAVDVLDDLMSTLRQVRDSGRWDSDRAVSDRWLAPRIHYALRLTRAEASDRGLWLWVALRYPWYMQWRWRGQDQIVAENRWHGPNHKQAFGRLWWGAETFRNGEDYSPVARAFVRQDLINSYLQHRLVRCRSLAIGILDQVAPTGRETEVSADQIRAFVKTLNLVTAGAPPEPLSGFRADDITSYMQWAHEEAAVPNDWETLPPGPPCDDTDQQSLQGVTPIVAEGWTYAESSSS